VTTLEPGRDVRAAVIGVGYLGRFHAQKYAALPGCRLEAVADADPGARERVAAELGTRAVADWRELLGQVDAVSIVTPTPLHHPIARAFLDAGAHVLVEKPMTVTVEEARDLIEVARHRGRVLQVGHLERFNAAVQAIEGLVADPRFIECTRLAPFKQRGTDVSVVLDLMIHDIDLVQSVVRSPLVSIDAVGSQVFSDDVDIANARLRFASGCVANVTASRVSLKTERKLRLFQDDAYLSVDLQQKILTVIRKEGAAPAPGEPPRVAIDERTYEQGDALKGEIEAFVDSIRTGRPPLVDGEAGLAALETAIRIAAQVTRSAT
jgi:predicted dehydrogenase